MAERLQILLKFLERFDDEVQGRELSEPAEETKVKLQRFARGTLSQEEQTEVFVLLDRNPEWTAWLAKEVKGLRANPINTPL
jgi:hypothetical protein